MSLWDEIWCFIKKVFQLLLDLLALLWEYTLAYVIELLPNSPFNFEPVNWGIMGDYMGYIFPIQTMFLHFTSLLVAITLFYSIRHIIRLVKMIK